MPPAPAQRGPWAVVLVAANDVLNVRAEATPNAAIVAKLQPKAKGVMGTGRGQQVGNAEWREVTVDGRAGWVNAAYLTDDVPVADFTADARITRLLDSLANALERKVDVTELLGDRGFYLATYDRPKYHAPKKARALFTSNEAIKFNGPACEACEEGSFTKVVGGWFLDAYRDPDRTLHFGQWREGGNASARLPTRLSGFPFVTVYDPGDIPDAPDWLAMTVFFEYRLGTPRIIGLAVNAWSP